MGRREFDVIVTFNVSSIVSINHLLIISHRAHLSQTLNHIHRLVSCVLFKTTRYSKTRLSNNRLQQNIAIFYKNLYTGESFSKIFSRVIARVGDLKKVGIFDQKIIEVAIWTNNIVKANDSLKTTWIKLSPIIFTFLFLMIWFPRLIIFQFLLKTFRVWYKLFFHFIFDTSKIFHFIFRLKMNFNLQKSC